MIRATSLCALLGASGCSLYFGAGGGGDDHVGDGGVAATAPVIDQALAAHGAYDAFTLQLSAHVTDGATCTLDPGDGSPLIALPSCDAITVAHTFASAGHYHAQLTASDDVGTVSSALDLEVPFDPPIDHLELAYEHVAIQGDVGAVAWRPDGAVVAIGDDKRVSFWDPGTGAPLGGWDVQSVQALAWSPDGTQLAVSAGDSLFPDTTIRDGATGAVDFDVGETTAFAWSPDGTRIAAAFDQTLVVATPSGDTLANLTGHTGSIGAVAWSPDGTRLVSGDSSGGLLLWRTDPGGLYAEVGSGGIGPAVTALAWSPDSSQIAIGTPYYLGLDSRDGTPQSTVMYADIASVAWASDGERLAVRHGGAANSFEIVDLATSATAMITGHTSAVRSIAWSPDGAHIASGADDMTMRVWDATSHAEVQRVSQAPPIDAVSWSPDGARLATSGGNHLGVLDAASGTQLADLALPQGAPRAWAWSPDGAHLAYADGFQQVARYDSASNTAADWIAAPAYALAWSSQGLLAISDGQHAVQVVDGDGAPVGTIAVTAGALAWTPSGELTTSAAGGIEEWDVNTGDGVATVPASAATALEWNPWFAELAIVADQQILVWDASAASSSRLALDSVSTAVWDPAGGKLATARPLYGEAYLWDAQLGGSGATLDDASTVAWSPDGGSVVVGNATGRLAVYRVVYRR